MGAFGNFVKQVTAGIRGAPTPPGVWGDLEKFGRFEGTGEVNAEVTLPAGPMAVSIEDYLTVGDLETQLTESGGEAVALRQYFESPDDDTEKGLKNIRRVAGAEIESPGLYHLTVKAPNSAEPLLILIGEG
ncbi:MAG: hypothetical protein ACJ75Z_11725 [Solirubrobacterales bacterium]